MSLKKDLDSPTHIDIEINVFSAMIIATATANSQISTDKNDKHFAIISVMLHFICCLKKYVVDIKGFENYVCC